MDVKDARELRCRSNSVRRRLFIEAKEDDIRPGPAIFSEANLEPFLLFPRYLHKLSPF